jgi:hypothetical protein
MAEWLIEDLVAGDAVRRSAVATAAAVDRGGEGVAEAQPAALAVRLHDLVVHNNKKWFDLFGGADVRVDVVVVQGNVVDGDASSAYAPSTIRFGGVADGASLATDDHGLLVYFGRPRHFLDISLMVSRDRKDSDDLAQLIKGAGTSKELRDAGTALLGLAMAAPQAAVVAGAVAAAAVVGNAAYRLVRAVSGTTIGVYRGNRLAYPDRFGVGRNPSDGSTYRKGDLSFWYEVVQAEPAAPA